MMRIGQTDTGGSLKELPQAKSGTADNDYKGENEVGIHKPTNKQSTNQSTNKKGKLLLTVKNLTVKCGREDRIIR